VLRFNEDKHQYYWHDKPVLNVTRALGPLTDYSVVDPQKLAVAQQEGKATHKMVELDIKDDLDTDSLGWLEPKWRGWRKFLADTGFKPHHSELKCFSPKIMVAGTLDILGVLGKDETIIDIKRSLYAGRVIGLQLAGYVRLCRDGDATLPRITRRTALVLGDGTYKLREFSDPNDENVFLSAVTMYRWLNGRDQEAA